MYTEKSEGDFDFNAAKDPSVSGEVGKDNIFFGGRRSFDDDRMLRQQEDDDLRTRTL